MKIYEEISIAMQRGLASVVTSLITKAIEEGVSAKSILDEALLPGMDIVGEKFKNNTIFVPEVLVAARAMNAGAAILKPYLTEDTVVSPGTVVIGTVKGDIHDIGKNLVKMMMEAKGLQVIDLGVSVPAEKFIAAAKEHGAKVIACSALLTTTMNEMKLIAEMAKQSLSGVKIIIGGAPVTQNFCETIGADGYTGDAATAAELALSLCKS